MRTIALRSALGLVLGIGLLVALNGRASFQFTRAMAQAGVCQFAAYGPGGGLINSGITCATPTSGGGGQDIAAGTCTSPSPNSTASPLSVNYTCATPTAFPTPSPLATTTAGPPSATWTTGPGSEPQLSINFPAGGGGGGSTPPPTINQSRGTLFNGSSVSTQLAATATSGDLLVMIVDTNSASATVTTPTGYTALGDEVGDNFGNWVYYRTATGNSSDTPTVSFSTSIEGDATIIEFTGAATPTGYAGQTTGSNNLISPTLSAAAGSLAIAVLVGGGNATAPITPVAWTALYNPGIASVLQGEVIEVGTAWSAAKMTGYAAAADYSSGVGAIFEVPN